MGLEIVAAQAGQIIAERYRLEEPLGHGAMGKIWRAEHLGLSSKVALKFLDQTVADTPEMFNRFILEAHSAAAVRSAHVVQILDCGVDGAMPYISMELLQGESLDQRLRVRGPLPLADLDKVMTEVALAVDHAHALGVVHRDLKPANIFIAQERDREITKVLDFGIAKLITPELDRDSAALTSSGILLGTPHYMSPEQARGSRSLDQRTDLWSLAIIAYECMTGALPFQGGSMGDIFVQICKEEPPPPSELVDVPPGFDAWFQKGTRKEPAERFRSASEMAQALSLILREAPRKTPTEPRHAKAASIGGTLRSEPRSYKAAPRSSSPVICTTPVWLPRTRARWLLLGAWAALTCSVAIVVWPDASSPGLGSTSSSGLPMPALSPRPAEPEAASVAVRELAPAPAPPPPGAEPSPGNGSSRALEPARSELPTRSRALPKRSVPRPTPAIRSLRAAADPPPAPESASDIAPKSARTRASEPAAALRPTTTPPTAIAPERDDSDLFSERR